MCFAWGSNRSGQIGIGNTTSEAYKEERRALQAQREAHAVKRPKTEEKETAQAKSRFTKRVTKRAAVKRAAYEELSSEALIQKSPTMTGCLEDGTEESWQCLCYPVLVEQLSLDEQIIKAVAAGSAHVVATDSKQNLWVWGDNSSRQLGCDFEDGHPLARVYTPMEVKGKLGVHENVMHVACGRQHTVAVTDGGLLYTWGEGASGCLGRELFDMVRQPTKVEDVDLQAYIFAKAAAGPEHTAVLTKYGDVFTCGVGAQGRLGHGTVHSEAHFRKIDKLQLATKGELITDVACGFKHTLVVTEAGSIFSFGCGVNGQLGVTDESGGDAEDPIEIRFFKSILAKELRRKEAERRRQERLKQFRQF